jgi:TonB family protein
MATTVPVIFFTVSCQEQIDDEVMAITKNSTHALLVPAHVQDRFQQLKRENPQKNYVVLELNETASGKLQGLQTQYGLPKSIEVFKTQNGKPSESAIRGEAAAGVIIEKRKAVLDLAAIEDSKIQVRQTGANVEGEQTFAILEFNDQASKLAEASAEDRVFTVVEQQPEFQGGHDALIKFVRENMRYPADSRQKGIEGTVYVSFVVEKDGSVTGVSLIKGIDEQCDAEAMRVVGLFPDWIPGKHNDEVVRVRFVMPVKYKL